MLCKIAERPFQDEPFWLLNTYKHVKCTLQYEEMYYYYGSWQTLEDSGPLFESAAVPKLAGTVQYSNPNPNIPVTGIADLQNSCPSEYAWKINKMPEFYMIYPKN